MMDKFPKALISLYVLVPTFIVVCDMLFSLLCYGLGSTIENKFILLAYIDCI